MAWNIAQNRDVLTTWNRFLLRLLCLRRAPTGRAPGYAAFWPVRWSDSPRVANPGGEWPTLRQLIDSESRLVILTDHEGGAYDWYLDMWAHSWETHFSARDPEDFSCADNRGAPDNSLFILNHFLTRTFGAPELAEMVNHNPFLRDRVFQCMAERGALPNFIAVDFYSIGDVLTLVDEVNGL